MREILFRGKRECNGEWVLGGFHSRLGRAFIVGCSKSFRFDACEVIPTTVGQYTGLTDKNGAKIFEGDILKEKDVVHNGEVQIDGKMFCVDMKKGCWVVIEKGGDWDFLHTNARTCEVVGNIHDNPELPEGGAA